MESNTQESKNNVNLQGVFEKTVNVKSLKKDLDNLTNIVSGLAQTVDKFVNTPTMDKFQAPVNKGSDYQPKGYVPLKYRQICDEILSPEFGLDCEEFADSMDFTVSVIVPERFSSLTVQEKQANVKDIRSKVISRAVGENGVREWCQKVRENLNKFYTSSGVVSPFIHA
jgi:hypothetical protein